MKYFFTNDKNDILKNKAELDLNIFLHKEKNTKRRKCDANKWI